MARRFETNYRMKDGTTRLSEDYFNPVLQDIDLRLHAQETVEKDWSAAVDTLNRFGLQRIDEYLSPAISKVQNVVELGFLDCSSSTPLRFEIGEKGVVVNEGVKRDLFVPSPFIAITRVANVTDYVVARTITWERETGALVFEIMSAYGNVGPHSDLIIHALPGSVTAIQAYIDQASGAATAAQNAGLLAEQARDAAIAAKDVSNAAAILIANGPVSSVNGKTGSVTLNASDFGALRILTYSYDDRAQLRSLTPVDGETATVDGLGVFVFKLNSDEPDDDESCFAASGGRWLLDAAHWDIVDKWMAAEFAYQADLNSQVLQTIQGTASSSITSISANSEASFTATISGAVVGDNVIATMTTSQNQWPVVTARVTGNNTVTITLSNPSASSMGQTASSWNILVFRRK